MNRNLILMILLLSSTFAFADLAPRDSFMITQPDGTTLWIHERGDEYFHWEETTDGFVIVPNAQGVYEYASVQNNKLNASGVKVYNSHTKSPAEKMFAKHQEQAVRTILKASLEETLIKRAEHQNRIAIPATPVIGTRKILTVLVGFTNYPFTYTTANFDSLLNYVGYSGNENAGSVKDYYLENSYNQLTLQSIVIGPFVAAHDTAYYRRPKGGLVGGHSRELVREAIEYAKTQNIDFSTLDGNNDGVVDCIHIVYAGNRYQAGGPGFIWPYHSNYDTTFVQNGHQITIADFIMTPEKLDQTYSSITSIGTICHEIGHVLGAPDFYPTGNYSMYSDFLGTGVWDVMAAGDQALYMGYYPAHHNPYTKTAIFRWNNQRTISSSEVNTLYNISSSSQDSTAIYKIPTATAGEYYLLENRQKVSFDSYLPYDGLLIYHIHKDIESSIDSNKVNAYLPQKCYLVNPDASQNQPTNISSYGQSMRNIFPTTTIPNDTVTNIFFTSQTTPRSQDWNGTATGVNICFIQHDGNNIKFVVNPQIEGIETFSDTTAWYHIRNVPAGATITWSINNHSAHTFEFITASPQNRDSMRVAFRQIPANPGHPINGNSEIDGLKPLYQQADLTVTVSSGGQSYSTTKNIRREIYSSPFMLRDTNSNDHIPEIIVQRDYVQITKINEVSTIEVWNAMRGRVLTQRAAGDTEQIDVRNLPKGVYIIVLKEGESIVAETKVLIQ